MHSHIKATLVGAVSAVAMFSFGSAAIAGGHLNATEAALAPLAKAEGSVTIIHPLFSDRTAQRMAAAQLERFGMRAAVKTRQGN